MIQVLGSPHCSGIERKVKDQRLAEWSIVGKWDPNTRYNPVGIAKRFDASQMIEAAKTLVKVQL